MEQTNITQEEIWDALCMRHTKEVQEKISTAKVAVCGLGGLGSTIAIQLARIGVGYLHLIDFDRVELTNLNRQQYELCHVGRYKTEALCEEIKKINPYLHIQTDQVKMTEKNTTSLLAQDMIVCEAFDEPSAKAMLVDVVMEQMPQKYLIAASGMAGYGRSNQIKTKRITKHFYLCGDDVSDVKSYGGLMAPRVSLCAAHQANLVVQLILGIEEIDC